MTRPTRGTPAGRAFLSLRALARRDGRPTDEVLVLFVLERFLYRLSLSAYRERLVLKGGMLLAAFGERRPTRDIDLLARAMDNDVDTIAALVRDVLAVEADDGIVFDTAGLTARVIRRALCRRPHRGARARQGEWSRFVRRHDLGPDLPGTYDEAIAIVAEFADPVVTGAVTSGRWDPVQRTWRT